MKGEFIRRFGSRRSRIWVSRGIFTRVKGRLWKSSYKSLERQPEEAGMRKEHWWRSLKER